jgi:acetyl-CoA C-acetyltransferase/acetyl-CoA acyltransferase
MEAVNEAAMRIRAGMGRFMVAGGCESMSNVPLLFPIETLEPVGQLARAKSAWQKTKAATALRPRHFKPIAGLELGLTDPTVNMIMGKTAEVLVQEFGISRREQDEYALRSHEKAIHATNAGFFNNEIVPVYAGSRYEPVTRDNGPRADTTMERLAKLRPLFDRKDGSVTVGNSCQITDGAATLLVADANAARAEGMEPLGYVKAYAYAALDPSRMGLGPVFAIDQILRQTGMSLSDIPLFEINEAFAGQVLACLRAMESDSFCRQHLDRPSAIGSLDETKLNVNGGAIALGHPLGCTGAKLTSTLLYELRRRKGRYGLVSMCVGGGMGAAGIFESL